MRRLVVRRRSVAFVLALVLWLPLLHVLIDVVRPAPVRLADELQGWLVEPWRAGAPPADAFARERGVNPEWDFMARTFVVLALANDSLANRAIAEPEATHEAIRIIDAIVADTIAQQREHGAQHFLLAYGRAAPFVDPDGRSLFVEGEIAMMLAARQLLRADPEVAAELRARVAHVVAAMERGPVLSGESYPDECWTFCNTTALAAIRMSDVALGEDHSALLHRWVEVAKARLVEPTTGLLVSSYRWDGRWLDGPEGSSLWMSAHNLLLVDPEFARAQFEGARTHLSRSALGFGWAREWPAVLDGPADIDSGAVVPGLDASAGSSGMALLGATAFGDTTMRDGLLRSLELAAFPVRDDGTRHFAAAGRIGNAVALYALRFGPLWARVGAPPPEGVP